MKMRITCSTRWTPDIPIHVSSSTFYMRSVSLPFVVHRILFGFDPQLATVSLSLSHSVISSIVRAFSSSCNCFYCYVQRNRRVCACAIRFVSFFVDGGVADIFVQCLDINCEHRKSPAFSTNCIVHFRASYKHMWMRTVRQWRIISTAIRCCTRVHLIFINRVLCYRCYFALSNTFN